jgi:hypothetical protein
MKKNLNEEISRIKDMMNKVSVNEFGPSRKKHKNLDEDDLEEELIDYILRRKDVLERYYDKVMGWTEEGKNSDLYREMKDALRTFEQELEVVPALSTKLVRNFLWKFKVGELDDIASNIRSIIENPWDEEDDDIDNSDIPGFEGTRDDLDDLSIR